MKETVPIIEINRDNASVFYPYLVFTIKNCTFIALDCEMSGLGNRKKLNSKNVDERYEAICEAASTRSLLSLGISCFTLKLKKKTKKLRVKCCTFNILTFCSKEFVVEPKSLEFLIKHGFDFNVQYSKGVPYFPGPDVVNNNATKSKKIDSNPSSFKFCLRQLFVEIVTAKKPLIMHNSLVDLVFLYENLYGPAPRTLQTFVADLTELFPAGIYDTKYIADYVLHTSASYLEFIFRKCLRENDATENDVDEFRLSVHFTKYPDFAYDSVVWANCPAPSIETNFENYTIEICSCFAFHGFCDDLKCEKSHDVDQILNVEEAKKTKKRVRRQKRQEKLLSKSNGSLNQEIVVDHLNRVKLDSTFETASNSTCEMEDFKKKGMKRKYSEQFFEHSKFDAVQENLTNGQQTEENQLTISTNSKDIRSFNGVHRAGFDAFMTGYCMAYFAMKDGDPLSSVDDDGRYKLYAENFINKVSLSGKDYPLIIQCSDYAKTSSYHNEKFQKLQDSSSSTLS